MNLLRKIKNHFYFRIKQILGFFEVLINQHRDLKIFCHDSDFFVIKKIRNACFRHRYLQCFEPPRLLRIEISTCCNAHCKHCPINSLERQGQFIDEALFNKIAEDAIAYPLPRIQFGGIGEPLLNPTLVEKVEHLKRNGIDFVEIMSNGSLLNRSMASKLIGAGLDRICISMDGTTKETYESQRAGLDFDQVSSNIHEFISLRGQAAKPLIHLNFARTKLNIHEWSDFLKLWGPKVDSVNSWPLWPEDGDKSKLLPVTFDNEKFYRNRAACPFIWHEMDLDVNGLVHLCCAAPKGSVIVGDLRKQSIREVWRSSVIQGYRQAHLAKNFSSLKICNHCDIWRFSHYRTWFC